ncbi:adenylyltransferase/cytidyltransferase family protein [Patescibacteria group bacterium]|nr:adenylyltransferase/cytidyltransferase family protein [Patescibacteria group bacterium]
MKKATKKAEKKKTIVAVSGGFDPIHIGHVRMIQEAKKLGDELVVIINNDHWLRDKKGFPFMPEHERKEIIEAIAGVDRAVLTDHAPGEYFIDRSVCRTLRAVKPNVFANGGDRKPDGDPVPEVALCDELGIALVYNVGAGGKVQSSSWLIAAAAENAPAKKSAAGSRARNLHAANKAV